MVPLNSLQNIQIQKRKRKNLSGTHLQTKFHELKKRPDQRWGFVTPESEAPLGVGNRDVVKLIGGTNGGLVGNHAAGLVRDGNSWKWISGRSSNLRKATLFHNIFLRFWNCILDMEKITLDKLQARKRILLSYNNDMEMEMEWRRKTHNFFSWEILLHYVHDLWRAHFLLNGQLFSL